MTMWTKIIAVIAAPFLLTGCLLEPGKFVSTLDIGADRSFTFTYIGEVHALDPSSGMGDMMKIKGDEDSGDGTDDSDDDPITAEPAVALWQDGATDDWKAEGDTSKSKGMSEEDKKALAETLSKEAGYRKVEYRGNDTYFIDYSISGTLDHAFLFPFNIDGEVVFPFVAIEIRANNTVRVKAPAFSKSASRNDMSKMSEGNDKIDGSFTLTTNAEIVSQNNEEGASKAVDGKRSIVWNITPTTSDAPMAVLRMAE